MEMKCVDCVFYTECEKFKADFNPLGNSCSNFKLRCDVSAECTRKMCIHNSDRPIFTTGNYSKQPVCGADPAVMVSDKSKKKDKKLKSAFRKGLRCGAKALDFNATVSHWFWDSNDVLQCYLNFNCGSGSLSINEVTFTGDNAYERMDGWELSPDIPSWLSPTGWLAKEPGVNSMQRRERIWFATVGFEYPYFVGYVVSESEGVSFAHRTMEEIELHLQKAFADYQCDPHKTFAYGFQFEPDWFDCKVKKIF